MTHFIGAVVVPHIYQNDVDGYLAKALDKFDENKEVPQYVSETREQIIANGKEYTAMMKEKYDKYLADPNAYEAEVNHPNHVAYLRDEFPARLKWTDDEHYEYQTRYDKPEELDENGGRYSTYNPDSKWDWYTIGGRWTKQYLDRQGESVDDLLADIERLQKIRSNPEEMAKIEAIDLELQKARESGASWQVTDEIHGKYLDCPAYMPWWFPRHIVFHNGIDFEWAEAGKTGWFGYRSEEQTDDEWLETLRKIVKSVSVGSTLYYIDFHI